MKKKPFEKNNKIMKFSAIVTAVNIDKNTISVLLTNEKKVIETRIKTIKRNKKIILLIPKIDSIVLIRKDKKSNEYIMSDVNEITEKYILTGIDEVSGQYFLISEDEISDKVVDLNMD